MVAHSLQAEGYESMTLAVEAMEAAIDTAGEAIDAALQCDVVKIGSGNWGYWIMYT